MSAQASPGSLKFQIKNLLKANVRPAAVAAHVGCDPSYVSQLLEDVEFTTEVQEARILVLQAAAERDASYDEIEDMLIQGLKTKVQMGASLMKTETLLRSIATVNNAKRTQRAAEGVNNGTIINNNIIQLTVPAHALRQFQVNTANEVIAVGQQVLVSMPAKQVLTMLVDQEKNKTELIEMKKIPDKEVSCYEQIPTKSKVAERVEAATISEFEI